MAVAVFFSHWTPPSQCVAPLVVPAQVINSSSVMNGCPLEPLLSEAKDRLAADISSTLETYCGNSEGSLCDGGSTRDNPVSSCSDLGIDGRSEYYWILPPNGSQVVQLYCDFDGQCCGCDDGSSDSGAWTRVGFLNMSDPNQDCPDTWLISNSSTYGRSCGKGKDTDLSSCVSALFPTSGVTYSRVCGRVTAYHDGYSQGLSTRTAELEASYLEGISLTRGDSGARQHVWSFITAAGEGNVSTHPSWLCNCSNVDDDWSEYSTSFVGDDYFCDTGNHDAGVPSDATYYDDPLWDGEGCGPQSTCCQFGNPPWFCKPLPEPTTDTLEVRNCHKGIYPYDTLVSLIEIYVQ